MKIHTITQNVGTTFKDKIKIPIQPEGDIVILCRQEVDDNKCIRRYYL